MAQGPLNGLKIVEFAGIGPGPFCGMLLSDLGADVVRIDRTDTIRDADASDIISRGRRSVALDLKIPASVETCLQILEKADAIIEGFRPGVMERLGLGPDVVLKRNPRLIYGRMTGWGQTGPLAKAAGHDLNYLSLVGVAHSIGTADKPVPPLNIVGDFGGGALYLAMGLLAGIIHARETGQGQIVDAAIVDGAASLMGMFYGMRSVGQWRDERQANPLDGGAHFYDNYRCADGKWISLGPIEPKFYALLLEKLGVSDPQFERQKTKDDWPQLKEKLSAVIAAHSREKWCELLEGTDVCFAPVLTLGEAPAHPHNVARETFITLSGHVQPAPAPRFSATPGAVQRLAPATGAHNDEVYRDWGLARDGEKSCTANA